ncbi:MAG: iron hydrogenase small subunit [Treponema sp.]|nr:iron hydrogenase small subunit [Treponema sp.]
MALRRSRNNPEIKQVYESFYAAPLSLRAKRLLHTKSHGWRLIWGERLTRQYQ